MIKFPPNIFKIFTSLLIAPMLILLTTSKPAFAAIDSETAYILNSLSFLMHGFLVMLMAAGFAMLEAGLVRSRNAAIQCTKNIALYSIAGLLFWLIGYNLMYKDVGQIIGSLAIWQFTEPAIAASGDFIAQESNYSLSSDWFFQMVFVATAASIVSGAVAERVKISAFLIFICILTGLIYPIQGAWSWGGGWLSQIGFQDFAGSTIVHSVGGWAALAGCIIIGSRRGKYVGGNTHPMPGSNLPLATLGTFILWFGWFGFNGGSQLAMGSAADINAIARIYVNTNIAAAAGVVVAMLMTRIIFGKIDLTIILNGALGGLVAITASPLDPSPALAVFIGAIAAILVVLTIPLLDKLKIDDVVGAIPVHLVCGIWGTIAVIFSSDSASLLIQLLGIAAVGAFTMIISSIVWFVIGKIIGLRVNAEAEEKGLDIDECGLEAYPEFIS